MGILTRSWKRRLGRDAPMRKENQGSFITLISGPKWSQPARNSQIKEQQRNSFGLVNPSVYNSLKKDSSAFKYGIVPWKLNTLKRITRKNNDQAMFKGCKMGGLANLGLLNV